MKIFGAILAAFLLLPATLDAQTVQTANGGVSGAPGAQPGFTVFKGIPYAAPPTGDLRWKPPTPAASWHGTRDATHFGPDCYSTRPGPDSTAGSQSEDCLYLNVWTPAKQGQKLPVMFWIYGGGFSSGSAAVPRYDGAGLNRKGVILVSFGYRTGVLGFLAHPGLSAESPHHASGNYGLLDAVAALKWVHANIAAFGGNPENVTIFGQSSGSETVNALTLSPLAKGLFAKAIGESGGGFGRREPPTLAMGEDAGVAYAAPLGGSAASLRAATAEQLIAAVTRTQHFEPVVDGWVLPMDAHAIYAAKRANDVPLLVGSNADESQLSHTLTRDAYLAQTKETYGAHADAVLAMFPAADDDQARASAKASMTMLLGDYNTASWAGGAARQDRSPIWQYRFTHVPPVAEGNASFGGQRGAYHGAELAYAFNNLDGSPRAWTGADRALETELSDYWTNFAKNGDPNGPGLPRWDRFDPANPRVLVIGDTSAMAPRPNGEIIDGLEKVFYGPDGLYAPKAH